MAIYVSIAAVITIISVLPLLVARIAAESAELQHAGATMRLMAQVIEQTDEMEGVDEATAKDGFRLAAQKLGIKTKFVSRTRAL